MKKKLTLAVFALAVITAGAFLVVKNYQGSNAASLYRAVAVTKLSDNQIASIQNTPTPAGIPTGPVVTAPLSCPASGYKFVTKWGGVGFSGNGLFPGSVGAVFVDQTNNVYVSDNSTTGFIQKFSSGGTYLSQFGGSGSGNGQFAMPEGIAVDSFGNIFVVDSANHRIQKFSSTGTYITQWGTYGSADGQFKNPWGIAIDSMGNIYVSDTGNYRIQKFNSNGVYLSKWGTYGTGNGQFQGNLGIAADIFGNIFVADSVGTGNNRIQKFTSSGAYISKWGTYGSGNGQFNQPFGIATDQVGNVYVVDRNNSRIQKFTGNGIYLTQFGTYGSADGQFRGAFSVAIDSYGNVYVGDGGNTRIQKFAPCTNFPVSITKPDLIVEDFTWTPSSPHVRVIIDPTKEPTPNTNFKVHATIKNIGSATATLPRGTQISFLKNGVSYGAQQLMNPVTLAVGQTYDVDVYQSTTPNILGVSGTFGLTVRVDDYAMGTTGGYNLVNESNEANNSLVKQITVLP